MPGLSWATQLGRHRSLGFVVVATFAAGRVILVLSSIPQPRFEVGQWPWLLGVIIFGLGIVFSLSAFAIGPFIAPKATISLKSTGFYRIVRNPILGELLWCVGWAIIFGSIVGIAHVPLWWASLLFLAAIEEQSLEREVGQPYLEYKKRVGERIIPGLPV